MPGAFGGEQRMDSTEELRTLIGDQLAVLDLKPVVQQPVMLRPSPQLQNLNSIYHDETSTQSTTTTTATAKLNKDISREVINEEPEEEEKQGRSLRTIAQELYDLRYTEERVDRYTALLGTNEQWNYELCSEFMLLFQWPQELVTALRLLCSRLYLIGEAAQIDQILEVFAKSWCHSYPKNQVGDYKSVHIVCFSLFILNSDLHNSQNMETTFTMDEFVTNTIYAIKEDKSSAAVDDDTLIETFKVFYSAIFESQLEILKHLPQQKLRRQVSIRRLFTPPRSPSTPHSFDRSSSSPLENKRFSNISLVSKNTNRLSSIGSTVSLPSSIRRISPLTDNYSELNYDVAYKQDEHDEELESFGPPWSIEGFLKCESQLPSSHQTQKKSSSLSRRLFKQTSSVISSELDIYSKDWKQSIVMISKGLLKQYSFSSASDRSDFIKTKSNDFIKTLVTYNLYSAVATLGGDNVISNASAKTQGVAWILTVPNLLTNDYTQDKKVVYYAPNLKVATDFVETCNFWASRITSIPSPDDAIVTNEEYGWSEEVLTQGVSLSDVNLREWQCLLSIESSFIPSSLDLESQLANMKSYVDAVSRALNDHNTLRPKLDALWGQSKLLKEKHNTVMTNWSEKYVYLLKQRTKYRTYLDSLALALSSKATRV